jgi:AP endonuclease-2
VVLEFPAFVLLAVYCPAARDESRDDFRLGFLDALDARIRNLVSMGKRVVVMGDLNIAPTVVDSAHALERIRKGKLSEQEYEMSSSRTLFRNLVQTNPPGQDDETSECVLLDLCRSFHPRRPGMYTCWEQRVNARPGNYGSRIDYVLCTRDMADWFITSDIQEGLMVSSLSPRRTGGMLTRR